MNKHKFLPKMAVKGIISNGTIYYPYLVVGIFAVFTYFVFASILRNDLIKTLPASGYAWVTLSIGKVLLAIILLFFLIYANSFLIKQRKKEIGLYSLLGLEKKHIGVMLFLETSAAYAVVVTGGIILGVVLSKVFFLLLLRLSNLPVNAEFTFTIEAFRETLYYFAGVFFINFVNQLWELGKSRPIELISGSRKGEKEPKLLSVWAVAGVVSLGMGYCIVIRSKIDSMIFINFFLAVFLVIIGTYLSFTSGSVAFLKLLRRSRKIYYQPANFITVSGMFYRMKKNAAGLANLCIFSTMVMITLICTSSLCIGMEELVRFAEPYDMTADFQEGSLDSEEAFGKIDALGEKYGLIVEREDLFDFIKVSCSKKENRFGMADSENYIDNFAITLMMLEDYNRITGEKEELNEGEILLHSTGLDFGFGTAEFMGITCNVRKETDNLFPYPKADKDAFGSGYVIVVKDKEARNELMSAWAEQNGVEDVESFLNSGSSKLGILLVGEEAQKWAFADEFFGWCQGQQGYTSHRNGLENRTHTRSMNGGLLFIGIIFGMIFILCLVIIMYYKQISEGYEDQGSFSIMQKVGMSDDEIKETIHRQILLLFGIPLLGALMHTFAGMFMVDGMMAAIKFFNTRLMQKCTVSVSIIFIVVYSITYLFTAKTYYRIVKKYDR